MPAPDPLTLIYCVRCRKPRNGKGWFGPDCMCDVDLSKAVRGPSVGTQR